MLIQFGNNIEHEDGEKKVIRNWRKILRVVRNKSSLKELEEYGKKCLTPESFRGHALQWANCFSFLF